MLFISSNSAAPEERIWQFITTSVILLAFTLHYFFFPEQSTNSYLLLLVFLTLQAQQMIPQRATGENQSFTDLQFHTEALFFISKYHSNLFRIQGLACAAFRMCKGWEPEYFNHETRRFGVVNVISDEWKMQLNPFKKEFCFFTYQLVNIETQESAGNNNHKFLLWWAVLTSEKFMFFQGTITNIQNQH